jgi:hypothetical protein
LANSGNVVGSVASVTNPVTTTQASADLVWSSTANNRLLTAGTNIVLAKGTGVTGFNDITAASVWTSASRTLTAGDNIALAKGTGVTGFNDITAASVWTVASRSLTDYDGVWSVATRALTDKASFTLDSGEYTNIWNKDISGWTVAGLAGTYLKGAGSAGDPWVTTLPGEYGSGTAGYIIGTNLNATVSSRGTSTLTTSDNIGINWGDISNPTTAVALTGTTWSTGQAVASVSGAVGSVTGGVTVTTNNDKTGYRLSATGIDDIWDETQTGHTTALSFGKYLDAQVSTVGGGSLTVAEIADGVWDELTASHITVGSFSELINGKKDSGSNYSDLEKLIRIHQ